MYIAYATIILLERIFLENIYAEILVGFLALVILFFVDLFLKWKFLSFLEIEIKENEEQGIDIHIGNKPKRTH